MYLDLSEFVWSISRIQFLSVMTYCSRSFMAHLDEQAGECGYTDYSAVSTTFPPTGPIPLPNSTCNIFSQIVTAARLLNPAFNIYHVFDTVCYPSYASQEIIADNSSV